MVAASRQAFSQLFNFNRSEQLANNDPRERAVVK